MRLNQRKTGVILTYVSEALKILTTLIYTPVMLRLLGQSEYGLYQLVNSTVSYLSLLSLGFGSAYVRYHSQRAVKEDHNGIAQLNGMFMIVFGIMACLCLICGGVMLTNIRVIFGSGLTEGELSRAKVLMALLVVGMAVTFLNSVFSCYVTAHEEFIFQKFLNILQNLFSPFLTLPLLFLGYGSLAVVGVSVGLTVAVFLSNVCFCRKKLKMRFSFRGLQFSLLREMWAFTFFIFLNQIIDQINWSVDKFLLGRMVGTAAVAVYGIGGQINTLYVEMSSAISAVFIPQVNRIVADTDDNEVLTKMMIKVGRVQFIVLALVAMGVVFFGRPFIRLWAGEGYEWAYEVALLLILPVTIPLVQNLGIEIQRAKNMHRARSAMYFCLALVNVVVSIFLIRPWGVVGAAAGTTISLILGNGLFMNWYYHKKIGLNMIAFWKEIGKFAPAILLVCLFGIAYGWFVTVNSWLMLLVSAGVFTVVYAVAMWFLGMNEYEKQLVRKMLRKLPGVK